MTDPLLEMDKKYVWHPFTQHATEPDPIILDHAKHASLFDTQGNEYLDLISSWWTCLHGHAHHELTRAIHQQARRMSHVMFSGFAHEPALKLAEALALVLPGDLSRSFFSDNGSTAVEVALKLAFQYWRNQGKERNVFLTFEGAYHGDTLGAMSAGRGSNFFQLYEDLMCEVEVLPFADTWAGDLDIDDREEWALTTLDNALSDMDGEVAAVIIEPLLQGAGGMRMCRPSFVKEVCDTARAAGVLVIFDEVATGFGRTGTLFACQQTGATPDIICLSKGLTGGYLPLSVTVTTQAIFDQFLGKDFSKAFAHGHSFTANPLGCAVALRSLELFDEDDTMARIAGIAAAHRAFAPELVAHPEATHIRLLGTVLAFDLTDDDGDYKSPKTEQLRHDFLANGLNIRPLGKTVYLLPPYCITTAELRRAYDGILDALDRLSG